MPSRRLIAYGIDLLLVTIILGIVFSFFPKTKEEKEIQAKMDILAEQYANKEIDGVFYFMQMSALEKEKSENQTFQLFLNIVGIICYYIVVPFLNHASTFGMQLLHLRIEFQKGKLLSLFLRAFFLDGLLSILLLLLAIYSINGKFYLSFVSVLLVLQLLTLIIHYFMIKCRKDKLGLIDRISRSMVIKMS